MEAPPPYMQPRKKSNTGLIIGLVVGGIFLCCIGPIGLLVGGGFWAFNKVGKPLFQCGATFTTARDSIRDYAKDHDHALPPAASWRDDVRTYYQKEMIPQPGNPFTPQGANEVWGCDNGAGGRTVIVYNSDVAGKNEKDLDHDDVILFEVQQATSNGSEKYSKQTFASSPAILNDHRGWFVAYWDGPPGFFDRRDVFVPFNTGKGGH